MPVQMQEQADGKLLLVKLRGTLTKQDYEQWLPEVERLIRKEGKIRLVVQMHDFHGWTMGALWEDIKFDWKHFGDIERLALVGDRKWEAGMALFCMPFTKAKIHYFEQAQVDEALGWIVEGLPTSHSLSVPPNADLAEKRSIGP
jgi:hypothetical protein